MADLKELIATDKGVVWRAVGPEAVIKEIQKRIKEDPTARDTYMKIVSRSKDCYCGSKKKAKHCCLIKYGAGEMPEKRKWLTRNERLKRDKAITRSMKEKR